MLVFSLLILVEFEKFIGLNLGPLPNGLCSRSWIYRRMTIEIGQYAMVNVIRVLDGWIKEILLFGYFKDN